MAYNLLAGLAALAASESTRCELSNVTAGTATCGSYNVSIKALVCGDKFDVDHCSTEWMNDVTRESEVYFFTALKDGLPVEELPPSCAGLEKGLSMAQYLPASRKCNPIGWVEGSLFYYVPDSGSKTPQTVTLNFTDHIGTDVKRDGYIRINCTAAGTPPSPYSTDGDSTAPEVFALDVQAPCAGTVAPIAPSYRCLNGTCVEHTVGKNTGITWSSCSANCKAGPPPPPPVPSNATFHCHHETRYSWMCLPSNQTGSTNRTVCDTGCQAPPQRYFCLGGECTKTNKSTGVPIDECTMTSTSI